MLVTPSSEAFTFLTLLWMAPQIVLFFVCHSFSSSVASLSNCMISFYTNAPRYCFNGLALSRDNLKIVQNLATYVSFAEVVRRTTMHLSIRYDAISVLCLFFAERCILLLQNTDVPPWKVEQLFESCVENHAEPWCVVRFWIFLYLRCV